MSKIYTINDKIAVKISDVTFFISPLKYSQKCELQSLMEKAISSKDMKYAQDAAFLSVKYSVKEVKGIERMDGSTFNVELENNELTEESVDNLLNIKQSTKLATVCASLVHGISNEIIDPYTGQAIEGISFGDSEEKKD